MSNNYFKFKQFIIYQDLCAMKVNTDSVLLGTYVKPETAKSILDIGTGTGLLAIQLSFRTKGHIIAIEIDPEACKQAQNNVKINRKEQQIEVLNIDFNNFRTNKKFDLIICNPPYFETGTPTSSKERDVARYTNTLSHEQLFNGVSSLLSEHGTFAVCLPYVNTDNIPTFIKKFNLKLNKEISVFPKTGKNCYLKIMFFSKNTCQKTIYSNNEEITIRDEQNQYTKEYKNQTAEMYLKF